jgi:hypothetical protein
MVRNRLRCPKNSRESHCAIGAFWTVLGSAGLDLETFHCGSELEDRAGRQSPVRSGNLLTISRFACSIDGMLLEDRNVNSHWEVRMIQTV